MLQLVLVKTYPKQWGAYFLGYIKRLMKLENKKEIHEEIKELLEKSGLFIPDGNQNYLKSGVIRSLYALLQENGMPDEVIADRIRLFLSRLDYADKSD